MKSIVNIETGHIYGHIDTTNDALYYNTLAVVGLTEIESDINNIYVLESNQL